MLKRLLIVVIVLLLNVGLVGAETYDGKCSIRFFGDSTLHGFEGKASCQSFVLTGENDTNIIRKPAITVLVADMDTDNSSRDKKMRTMFDSENYPAIIGLFDDLQPEQVLKQLAANGNQPGQLNFNLKIRDKVQPVKAEISELKVSPEGLVFKMKFSLSLKSFGLKAPGVFGLIRVADQIDLEVDATLQRK